MTDRSTALRGIALGAVLRALRREADLSQRELANISGVAQATVSRIEAGTPVNPSFRTVERLIQAAGASLAVTNLAATQGSGGPGIPAIPHETWRDVAGRHYPAHLDIEGVTRPERWWGAWWASTTIREKWPLDRVPPATYELNRSARDERRQRAAMGAQVAIRGGPRETSADRSAEWIWTAERGDGEVIGEIRAHEFDLELDGAGLAPFVVVAEGTVVLDGIVVAPAWRRLGIGRRLFQTLRNEVSTAVVALTADSDTQHFLSACGFAGTRDLRPPRWFASRPL